MEITQTMAKEKRVQINKVSADLSHSKIETEKITNKIWMAKCTVYNKGLKFELSMKGNSEDNSIEKIIKFLNSK